MILATGSGAQNCILELGYAFEKAQKNTVVLQNGAILLIFMRINSTAKWEELTNPLAKYNNILPRIVY